MIEADLLPVEPAAVAPELTREVDPRGWVAVIIVLIVVGCWSLRPPPAPTIPQRIAIAQVEPWMVDALPGIGARTRERYWRLVRDGALTALPERARAIAHQVFTRGEAPTHSAPPPAR